MYYVCYPSDDDNRVTLKKIQDDPLTEYINASFIPVMYFAKLR